MAKAIATKQTAEVVPFNEDAFDQLPSGMENVTAADLKIPRLTILQALSPQLVKGKTEFISGANAGDFCDTALKEVFKDDLLVVPVYFTKQYVEWFPRDSGKGLAAIHGSTLPPTAKRDDKLRYHTPNGNYVADVMAFYVVNLSGQWRRSFLPLQGTQIKHAKNWLTAINAIRRVNKAGDDVPVPIYYKAWKASVVQETNNQGSWFSWAFQPDQKITELDPSGRLLKECVNFLTQVKEGAVVGDVAGMADEQPANINKDEQEM